MAATPAAHVHIEARQTAVPTRTVEPGRTRLVSVAAPPLAAAALQRRVRAVLYYRGDGAPWEEEGVWVKETLSEALANHPEMAGRLRHRADGSWEVKLNDAGMRFLQATADASMEEFLADKDRTRKEAALAPWTEVEADDPDMCAPFSMQLTRFQGDGGYAVGVSCSLLLSDPLSLARFLLSWARTHAAMKAHNKVATHPMMQYMGYFQRADVGCRRIRSVALDSFAAEHGATSTVLLRAGAATGSPDNHRALARACIDRVSEELGAGGRAPRFSVVVAAGDDGRRGTTIETCVADGMLGGGSGCALEAAQWSDLGLEELVLRDTKPVQVSCTIVAEGDEGLVVVMPDGDGFLVTATIPK